LQNGFYALSVLFRLSARVVHLIGSLVANGVETDGVTLVLHELVGGEEFKAEAVDLTLELELWRVL